jgi:hypothetical protein
MFDQLFDNFRKASESSLQAQQEMFKQWMQQWPALPKGGTGGSAEWSSNLQKRWLESMKETLNRHREVLDTTYRSGIQVIEQTFRVSDAKSPDEYQRLVQDLWRKLSETFREQSEAQVREFQKASERWLDVAQQAQNQAQPQSQAKA